MATTSVNSLLSGGASGSVTGQLDVQYIVEQLIYAKQEPIRELQTYETFYKAKKTAFQELNTKVSALESSLYSLNSSAFQTKKAALSSETNLTASATSTASKGTYSILVKQLATAKSTISTTFASADTQLLSNGKVTIKNYDGSSTLGEIDFSSGTMSLNQLKDQINSLGLDITATVVNYGTSAAPDYRMQITSDNTGVTNGFTIQETGSGTLPGMSTTIAAQDSQIYVNTDPVATPSLYISRSSNTIDDVISGVTLNLKQAVDTPLTLSKASVLNVTSDSSAIEDKIQSFITAFNDAMDYLNTQFKYDEETQKAGVLSGESAAVKVKQDLLSLVTNRVAGIDTSDPYKTLSVIGISMTEEGKLEIDSTKLDDALTNHIDSVQRIFKDMGSTTNAEASYIGSATATQGGKYGLYITRAAERAVATGADNIDTLGNDEKLTITYGGKDYIVNLTSGMTSSQVVSAVNTAASNYGIAVSAQVNSGKLEILSTEYGSSQSVAVVSDQASDDPAGSTGIGTVKISDTGVNVAGKFIDPTTGASLAASGSGTILTGTSGNAKGLIVSVSTTSVTDTVNGDNKGYVYFTRGVAETLRERMDELSFPYTGIIARNIDSLDEQLQGITDKISSINRSLASEQDILITQYTKANEALAQMTYLLSQMSGMSSK